MKNVPEEPKSMFARKRATNSGLGEFEGNGEGDEIGSGSEDLLQALERIGRIALAATGSIVEGEGEHPQPGHAEHALFCNGPKGLPGAC